MCPARDKARAIGAKNAIGAQTMIQQSESGLTTGEYSELETLRTGQAYSLTLQRLSFSWTTLEGSSSEERFDAAVTDTQLVRVLGGSAITVEGRASDDIAWSDLGAAITGAHSLITPSVWAGGQRIVVYYYDGSAIQLKESLDDGVSWGSASEVDTVANVAFIAGVSASRVHYATFDNYNTRFHFAENDGGWASTDSALYWPNDIKSFDAETQGAYDVIVFDAEGQTRYTTCRQGVWSCRQKGSSWGDPEDLDMVDEYLAGTTERELVMLSKIDGRLFACYLAQDGGFQSACYSQSGTGRFWQHRQPLGAIAVKCKMLTLGDYTYLVNGELLYRSDSTPIVGNSTVEYDISSRATEYEFARARMHQLRVTLDNDDAGLLDLTGFERWQIVEELGYWSSVGAELRVQIALTEVDAISTGSGVPVSEVKITARDRLAWMTDRTQADHYREWNSQLKHWDDFENVYDETADKEILHSGMGYTAGREGYWSTEEGAVAGDYELRLKSNNREGLALCTIRKFIGHTIVQEAIQVPTAGNDEWAGVVFRSLDEDNYWCAYYDQATDTIKLRQKRSGTWQTAVATTGALSWSVATWYWIRVEARLSRYVVYYSTDGATWTQAFAYVDQQFVDETLDFFREGYVGHAGYGYSDEDTEPYEPPDYDPPGNYIPPDETLEIYGQFIIGSYDGGVAYCDTLEDIITGSSPTWVAANGGLVAAGSKVIEHLVYSQELGYLYASTACGIYRTTLPLSGSTTWTAILDAPTILGVIGGVSARAMHIVMDWDDPLKQWCLCMITTTTRNNPYVLRTTDGWSTWLYVGLPWSAQPQGRSRKCELAIARNTPDVIYAAATHDAYDACVYRSTNGGVSFSQWYNPSLGWQYQTIAVPNGGTDQVIACAGGAVDKVQTTENGGSSWYSYTSENTPTKIRHRQGQEDAMYFCGHDSIREWNPSTNTWDNFWGGGADLWDLLCVGWGTNNALGIVISVGYHLSAYRVMRYTDYAIYTDLTSNLHTVAPGITQLSCIATEGGQWTE